MTDSERTALTPIEAPDHGNFGNSAMIYASLTKLGQLAFLRGFDCTFRIFLKQRSFGYLSCGLAPDSGDVGVIVSIPLSNRRPSIVHLSARRFGRRERDHSTLQWVECSRVEPLRARIPGGVGRARDGQ